MRRRLPGGLLRRRPDHRESEDQLLAKKAFMHL